MLPGKKTNFLEVNTKTRRHPHQKKSFGIAMWKSQHRGTHFNVSGSKLFPKVLSREAKSSNLLQTWFSESISFLRKDKISRPISKRISIVYISDDYYSRVFIPTNNFFWLFQETDPSTLLIVCRYFSDNIITHFTGSFIAVRFFCPSSMLLPSLNLRESKQTFSHRKRRDWFVTALFHSHTGDNCNRHYATSWCHEDKTDGS